MFRLELFLLLFISFAHGFQKCCDYNTYLSGVNPTISCQLDEDKRIQIYYPNQTNFLLNNSLNHADFECVDVSNKTIKKYVINHRKIISESKLDVNYFTKCCPLNYSYNLITHSCQLNKNYNNKTNFITQHFIKVGLPHCRIIVDYKLNIPYRLEMGILFIQQKFFNGEFCLDQDENGNMVARGCHKDLDVCTKIKCLHKCCPDGQSFVGGQTCVNTYKYGMNHTFQRFIKNSTDPYGIIHNYNCRIYKLPERNIAFYIDERGVFWVYYNSTGSFVPYDIEDKSYCIEHAKKGDLDRFSFFMCYPENSIPTKILLTRWIKIVSCVFIALTIIVYCLLPDMMNLFGNILISYCFATLSFYIVLTYNQFVTESGNKLCFVLSFFSVYISLAQFMWLNVMCFNIYWTFGSTKILAKTKQYKADLKKFLFYSAYGWGLPICLTLVIYLAYSIESTPYNIKPLLGKYKCFWETPPGNYGMYLYYTIPLGLIEIIDVILFVKTIIHCLKIKREIKYLNDNRVREKKFKYDKEQLCLIIKLSVCMGISFTFEIVSSFYTFTNHPVTKYIEIVWDSFNCLQGVFIFIIFVCKQRVLTLFRRKYIGFNFGIQSSINGTTQTTEQESIKSLNSKNNI